MNQSGAWQGLLIIANYNQVDEIQNFLERVEKYFPKDHCLIVDDGSTDGSAEIGEKLGYKVIRHVKNRGIGAAIRTGLEYGVSQGYRWVLISSSNGKCRPEDFAAVYTPVLRNEADYVTGNRFLEGGGSPGLPRFRRISIPLFSLFASVFIGRRFRDITCGFRCYVLDILKSPGIELSQSWLDRYELEYYLHYKTVRAKRFRVVEVPVTIHYTHIKPGRTSKIRPIIDWWSMIRPFVLLALRIRK